MVHKINFQLSPPEEFPLPVQKHFLEVQHLATASCRIMDTTAADWEGSQGRGGWRESKREGRREGGREEEGEREKEGLLSQPCVQYM